MAIQLHVFPISALDWAKMSVCDCVRLIPEKMAKEFPSDSIFIILQFNNYVTLISGFHRALL